MQGQKFQRLFEPFAGSAAITIAAASEGLADEYIIGDSLAPLVAIWNWALEGPEQLADAYAELWHGQGVDDPSYYYRVRDEFNRSHDPARLLYLLARCAKNAPRFNQQGAFNQSPDRRRLGMRPEKMRAELLGVSKLLAARTSVRSSDFEQIVAAATDDDLVYLDPPYQGTTIGTDKRYHQGLDRDRLIAVLADLNRRGVPFLLSYDGRCGAKTYGAALPDWLGLLRLELEAGRSAQATLNGREERTVESLYVSPGLCATRLQT